MHPHEVRPPRPHILIAGGGVAAIEALLALRRVAGELVSIELIAPPSALTGPDPLDVEALARNAGARLRREAITGVHSARRVVLLAGGGEVRYDRLIVAIGALRKPAVPGAVTFSRAAQTAEVADLVARGHRRIHFQVEPGRPLPAAAVVSAPVLDGPSLGGLPCDPLGFLAVDADGRVRGVPRVYAAGDATGRTGGRGSDAAQQAHAAAAAVAADLGLAPDAACAEPQALAFER